MTVNDALLDDGKDVRALKFVETHAQALGIVSDRVELNVHAITTTPDRSYVRIKQQYDGIPVHGAEIVMQIQPDGTVKSFLSDIMTDTAAFDGDPSAMEPGLDRAAASEFTLTIANRLLQKAQEDYEADIAFAVESGEIDAETAQEHLDRASATVVELTDVGELQIYAPHVVGDSGENALAWAVKVNDTLGIMTPVQVFINADTGDLLRLNPLAAHAINRRLYDDRLLAEIGIPFAILRRTETSGPVTILQTIHYVDFNAHWDILGYTYDYFAQNHGWDAMDGVGGTIRSYMRYILGPNAAYGGGILRFGTVGFAVSDDVVAHEYTHGVLENVVGLYYVGEAGAINESLADMWGEFVDWSCPVLGNDGENKTWKLGEGTGIGVSRNMKNPPAKDQPDTYLGTNWYSGGDNSAFVHINSGVGNKLVYLLTDGDTFNGETINGMGETDVRELYWEALQLMPVDPDYNDLYQLLLDAADNLAMSPAQVSNIQNGCEAVEIN
jgi:Zn-dependent metalloprotease